MPALCFSSDDHTVCQLKLADARLPEVIKSQLAGGVDVWFEPSLLQLDVESSDIADPGSQPLFFEWQRLEWLFEPSEAIAAKPPYAMYVNGVLEPAVTCRQLGGRQLLSGSFSLGNAVGKTRFSIRDSRGKPLFELGAEVFPQKLDYKDDFPAMLDEITDEIYSLAFDAFKKTYASTQTRTTYYQTLSEWLNLYKVLASGFEQSIDTLLRSPKLELKCETRLKPVSRVRRATHRSVRLALQRPAKHCRGGGVEVAPGLHVSHLQEQHRRVSYDTRENRFVVWAIRDVISTLNALIVEIDKKQNGGRGSPRAKRLDAEMALLRSHQRKLRFRLMDPKFAEVGEFNNQQQFSTTLTMAPGYKEFYHRYLLLRKGLTLSDSDIFKMDYKDVATLYEYWCFLKTVKLLRENPKYDLTSTDIVKIEHQRFSVNLKKGKPSAVNFKQRSSGDVISLFFNRRFSGKNYTHTFDQVPDNFIEFSRAGYVSGKDAKTFKVVLDAKYRFDRGSESYPVANNPYGPPLDSIAQLHRYRDAILWQQDSDDSVKVANKSLGGVILFPYPNDETEFKEHPFYKSIERVNIGAIPLQPGPARENKLYCDYLDALFEQSGESLSERTIRLDTRNYDAKRRAHTDTVLVGMVPSKNREARLVYHSGKKYFYTQWAQNPQFPLEKVKVVALYDQKLRQIYAWADVLEVEFLLGSELAATGTTWSARKPDSKHCVYRLGELNPVEIPAGPQMSSVRTGRFIVSRLGLELALEHGDANLLYVHSWEKYQEWKNMKQQYPRVAISRKTRSNSAGGDDSELVFTPSIYQE